MKTENMLPIINQLASIKQLEGKTLFTVIKDSLYLAISKKLIPENNLEIVVDSNGNKIFAHFDKFVVEQDINLGEISLETARKTNPKIKIGDTLHTVLPINDFEPKIIYTAKKIIQDNIKKLENDRLIFDYEKQKNQIVTGTLQKIEYKDYVIDLGYAEAILPFDEQIDKEYYKQGSIVQAYTIDIKRVRGKMTIVLSRKNPEYIKKLFINEVPEIASGEVIIKKIVRDPGKRSKVAVFSKDTKIDAIGSCLGEKGMRMKSIKNYLYDEKIDIVLWSESKEQFIANALGRHFVEQIYLAEHGRFARIISAEKNKNILIGKGGLNVKLASKLTEYKIDIFTKEELEEQMLKERRIVSHIEDLDGITESAILSLKEKGYTSVEDIYKASIKELCKIKGIGEKMAEKLKYSANNFF